MMGLVKPGDVNPSLPRSHPRGQLATRFLPQDAFMLTCCVSKDVFQVCVSWNYSKYFLRFS